MASWRGGQEEAQRAPRAGKEHDQGPLGGAGIEIFSGREMRGVRAEKKKTIQTNTKNAVLVSAPVSRSIVD